MMNPGSPVKPARTPLPNPMPYRLLYRSGDPMVGEFGDARVLKAFGQVPDDLSGL
jgi:hypothetical protein